MSKNVIVSATVGPAKYSATVEVSPEQEEALLRQGLLRIFQGKPSGQAEKALAYPGKDAKRPEGFKRSDLEFNAAFEKAFTDAYEGAKISLGEDESGKDLGESAINLIDIKWEAYEGGSAPEPKFARAKLTLNYYLFNEDKTPKLLKTGGPRTAVSFAEARTIPLPTEPWEEDTEFLKAVTEWLKEDDRKRLDAEG